MKMPLQSPDNSSARYGGFGHTCPLIFHILTSQDAGFISKQLIWLEENSSKAVAFRPLLIPPECQQFGVDTAGPGGVCAQGILKEGPASSMMQSVASTC